MKVDLHTHSEASRDGGITPDQYAELLQNEVVDVIAITDHDRIDFARGMQKALGADRIIVGQEITTTDGDLIGLYLTEPIEAGLSAQSAIDAIKSQSGLVYVPHPFETLRKGIAVETLDALAPDIDIVEGYNGRALLQNRGAQARNWAMRHGKLLAASSDAHGVRGVGLTYTVIDGSLRTASDLLKALQGAEFAYKRAPLLTMLYPTRNKIINKIRGL